MSQQHIIRHSVHCERGMMMMMMNAYIRIAYSFICGPCLRDLGLKCPVYAVISKNKKFSYRKETARHVGTWRGLGPPAHSLSAPSGYNYAYGRI